MFATGLATGERTMADRFCRNCGNEISENDRFCANCGAPVHQAAHVPTPETDVPVPPPPRGTGGPSEQSGTWKWFPYVALLVLVGLVVIAAIPGISGGGGSGGQQEANSLPERAEKDEGVEGGGPDPEAKQPLEGEKVKEVKPQAEKKPKPKPEYAVGQTAKVGNVEWTVTDAFLTNQLKSTFGTQKRGRFVVVDFTFVNNRNEEVTLDPELHMVLKDSQGREFGTDVDAFEFVPIDLDIFLEPVNPGVSTNGRVIYQVAPDAAGFKLTVDDVEFLEDKSAVYDLSNIPARAYDPASASASATATAGP
jgi:hypothetical protein